MAKPRRLPPLQSLAYFECAGRLLNFTAAARELGTSQPAVSQRIGMLEEDLGVPLFKREHRGVALTADGRLLLVAVRESLAGIGDAVARIRARHSRQVLTVAADFIVATWLMPRLSTLRAQVPDLDVRIITTQEAFDIRGEPVDIAIAFGAGHWPGCSALGLFPEIVIPVCSPDFAAKHGLPATAAAVLAGLPLLHLESTEPPLWLGWESWFARQNLPDAGAMTGIPTQHDLSLNNEPLVMQAAIAGQGLALGWVPLVDDLVATGQLVPALLPPTRTAYGYFLVEPQTQHPGAAAQSFRSWMVAECARAMTHSRFA